MTLSIDDLVKLHDEHSKCIKLDAKAHAMRVVVTALRDEIIPERMRITQVNDACSLSSLRLFFNYVLASGGDEAAGVLAVESREGAMISEAPEAPAAAPDDVCVWKRVEWTPLMSAHWATDCGDRVFWTVGKKCPTCTLPIRFVDGGAMSDSKTLEGMIRTRSGYIIGHKSRPDQFNVEKEAMRAAMLWLADNVSDEMAEAWHRAHYIEGFSFKETCENISGYAEDVKDAIAAALRQAAGGEG